MTDTFTEDPDLDQGNDDNGDDNAYDAPQETHDWGSHDENTDEEAQNQAQEAPASQSGTPRPSVSKRRSGGRTANLTARLARDVVALLERIDLASSEARTLLADVLGSDASEADVLAAAAAETSTSATARQASTVIHTLRLAEDAEDETILIASQLLGCDAGVTEVAVAAVTAEKSVHDTAAALAELRGIEDAMERIITVAGWDEKKITTPAWRLLHAHQLVERQMPKNQTKAAAKIASAVDEVPEQIRDVVTLLS